VARGVVVRTLATPHTAPSRRLKCEDAASQVCIRRSRPLDIDPLDDCRLQSGRAVSARRNVQFARSDDDSVLFTPAGAFLGAAVALDTRPDPSKSPDEPSAGPASRGGAAAGVASRTSLTHRPRRPVLLATGDRMLAPLSNCSRSFRYTLAMRKRGDSNIESYLNAYPGVRRWVTQCSKCSRYGSHPDAPYDNFTPGTRQFFNDELKWIMPVDGSGLCRGCAAAAEEGATTS